MPMKLERDEITKLRRQLDETKRASADHEEVALIKFSPGLSLVTQPGDNNECRWMGAPGAADVGSAFIALAGDERNKPRARLDKVERCPLARFQFPDAQWVKPRLVARVRYLAGTKYIRHGTVRGFTWQRSATLISRVAASSQPMRRMSDSG